MSKLQKILYPVVILALIVLTAVTWGSIGSIVFMLGALMSIPIYFWQRFLNTDGESDFKDDDNS